LGGTLCKIGSPLLSFLLCSLCTPLQKILKTLGVVKDVLGSKVRGMCIPTGSSVCKSVGGHGC